MSGYAVGVLVGMLGLLLIGFPLASASAIGVVAWLTGAALFGEKWSQR